MNANDAAVVPPVRIRSRRKLSDQVRDGILADYIVNGTVPPNERLPTEAEFCARYAVSRVTVRAALRSLEEAGLIVIRQGMGSTVLPRPETISSGLDRLCSVETFARAFGAQVETAALEVFELDARGKVSERLAVQPGTRALCLRRVKLYGGSPIGWIVDYVPTEILPVATIVSEFAGSVLDVLLAHPELAVEYADCDVVPVALNGELAARLGVEAGTAALYLDEQTRTRGGRVVNWSQAWLLPEHLRFCLRRRRQDAWPPSHENGWPEHARP